MTGRVRDFLAGGGTLRWLRFGDYAWRVFGAGDTAWFLEPEQHARGLADANRTLGSAVIEFDLGALWRARRAVAGAATGVEGVGAILADAGVRAFVRDAVAALVYSQRGRADVVLALPAPAALLAGLGEDPDALTFDQRDDIATLLVGAMRDSATAGVDGLVLEFTATGAIAADDELEACAAIKNAAGHYGWVFAARAPTTALIARHAALGPDLWLVAQATVAAAVPAPIGAGLDADFWRDGTLARPVPAAGAVCRYGEVPAELDPRLVAERVGALP